eukprot:TRINITY_DN30439_c0_g1_i2.p1 TRINITY_DN30439_c0_g1~~TRINITY_DN30439_c0_g1_i2.p1  ORF type:complete len:273 (-),score=52.84 TRINITY_DN30439_c0_g1_i2:9-827(-)
MSRQEWVSCCFSPVPTPEGMADGSLQCVPEQATLDETIAFPITSATIHHEISLYLRQHEKELHALLDQWLLPANRRQQAAWGDDDKATSLPVRKVSTATPSTLLTALPENSNGASFESGEKLDVHFDVNEQLPRQVSADAVKKLLSTQEAAETSAATPPESPVQSRESCEESAFAIKKLMSTEEAILQPHAMHFEDNCSGRMVRRPRFDQTFGCLIAASSLIAGLEVEMQSPRNSWLFLVWNCFSASLFTLELLIRLDARRIRFFTGAARGS